MFFMRSVRKYLHIILATCPIRLIEWVFVYTPTENPVQARNPLRKHLRWVSGCTQTPTRCLTEGVHKHPLDHQTIKLLIRNWDKFRINNLPISKFLATLCAPARFFQVLSGGPFSLCGYLVTSACLILSLFLRRRVGSILNVTYPR